MICLICREAELINGFTSVSFERTEMKLEVRHVPALVCPNCGEAYVDEVVAERLLQRAEEKFNSGDWNVVQEYE